MKTCPACDAVLFSSECRDGWCERCGKKLPESLRASVCRDVGRAERAAARPTGSGGGVGTAIVVTLVLLFFGVLFILAAASDGPEFLIRAGIKFVAVVLVAGVIAFFKAICSSGNG